MEEQTSSSAKVDVNAIVTNRIISLLEKGTIPWKKPWAESGIPMNVISKRPYRGINLWLLLSLNYTRNLFLTWDQLKKLGGSVKQGEHGHVVVFWKTFPKEEAVEVAKQKQPPPILRYYKVFNIEQCRDLPEDLNILLEERKNDPIAACELMVAQMPLVPMIKQKEQQAYYHPVADFINMPKKKTFKSSESYYGTLFHELVHSTGHEKRLNRKSVTEMAEFGSETYSLEELIAELGSSYLASHTGILHCQIENNASYIKGWLSKLRDDKRFILQASGAAQKAVDYILNQKEEVVNVKEEVEQPEMIGEE